MAIRTEDHNDLCKFGNRLWKLMESKKYGTPRELAIALYDSGLVKVDSRHEYNTPEENRKNAIGSTEKKIIKHIRASNADAVQGEFILAYCKHFNCSSDYLLGLTEIVTNNLDIRRICELTGLSEVVVTNLAYEIQSQDGSSYITDFWSMLMESDLFMGLPLNWSIAYKEKKEEVSCKAYAAAIPVVLKNEDPSSVPYNLIAIKEKSFNIEANKRHAAYYGMIYKIANNITYILDKLSDLNTAQENIYEKETEAATEQFKAELCKFKNEPLPPNTDEKDFHWHKHIMI